MWFWGYKIGYDYEDRYARTDTNFVSNFTSCMVAHKMDWFEKNGIRVLDFSAAECYVIMRVEDRSSTQHIYALMSPFYHKQVQNCFFDKPQDLFKQILFKLDNIDASQLLSFDCGSYMSMFVKKPVKTVKLIIPGRQSPSGLTHVYKEF